MHACAWEYQWARVKVCIYHLLCAAFCQGVAVTQVIDLDIFDEVTILLVDLVLNCGWWSRWRLRCASGCTRILGGLSVCR
jgi:hypothetical protein